MQATLWCEADLIVTLLAWHSHFRIPLMSCPDLEVCISFGPTQEEPITAGRALLWRQKSRVKQNGRTWQSRTEVGERNTTSGPFPPGARQWLVPEESELQGQLTFLPSSSPIATLPLPTPPYFPPPPPLFQNFLATPLQSFLLSLLEKMSIGRVMTCWRGLRTKWLNRSLGFPFLYKTIDKKHW